MTVDDRCQLSTRDAQESASSRADFDADDYRPYLDGLELDQQQEDELMRIVWNMMHMSVELNIPAESWGQIVDAINNGSADESGDID